MTNLLNKPIILTYLSNSINQIDMIMKNQYIYIYNIQN